MIKLYQYPSGAGLASISPPCQKVQLVMKKMGLDYETVNLQSKFEAQRHSPSGRLPAIDLDGEVLCESSKIVDRLASKFPDKAFFPTDPFEAAQDRLWDEFAAETIYSYVGYVRWMHEDGNRRFIDFLSGKAGFLVGRVAVPLFFAPGFRKRMRLHGVGLRSSEDVAAGIDRAVEMVDACLQGGPFLYGRPTPGRGDVSVAAHLATLLFPGGIAICEDPIRRRPAVREHLERVFESCGFETPAFVTELAAPKSAV